MRLLLLALTLGTGCIIRSGPPPGATAPTAAVPGDLAAIEVRLDDLLSSNDDLDRRDRLMAALDLARQARHLDEAPRAAIVAYLEQLAAIEARNEPFAAPAILPLEALPEASGSATMLEETLGEAPELPPQPTESAPPAEIVAPAEAPPSAEIAATPPVADDLAVQQARQQLASGDLAGALASLETCRGQPCWGAAEPLWAETRDRYVFAQREAAGARYLASRELDDRAARIEALRAVRDELSQLLSRYPDTRYADALQRNIALVSQELSALEGDRAR